MAPPNPGLVLVSAVASLIAGEYQHTQGPVSAFFSIGRRIVTLLVEMVKRGTDFSQNLVVVGWRRRKPTSSSCNDHDRTTRRNAGVCRVLASTRRGSPPIAGVVVLPPRSWYNPNCKARMAHAVVSDGIGERSSSERRGERPQEKRCRRGLLRACDTGLRALGAPSLNTTSSIGTPSAFNLMAGVQAMLTNTGVCGPVSRRIAYVTLWRPRSAISCPLPCHLQHAPFRSAPFSTTPFTSRHRSAGPRVDPSFGTFRLRVLIAQKL